MMTAILHEGDEIARAYNARGFHAVVVRYRVAPNRYPVPQMDLIRAIKLVRGHAAEWQIEPDHVAVCGFSAGGHLTASVGALHDAIRIPGDEYDHLSARPDALVLSYAVISFTTYAHEGSVTALLGSDNSAAMRAALSCQNRVDGNYPPSFIWTCAVDESVPIENSKLMAEACRQAGVPHELKMYPGGRHGVGLGIGLEAEPWLAQSAAFLRSIFSGS
jgi:acetyl esterase/lipase